MDGGGKAEQEGGAECLRWWVRIGNDGVDEEDDE